MDYELFKNVEDGTFGVNWLTDDGIVINTDFFKTAEEREEAIDRWYANNDKFTPEQ